MKCEMGGCKNKVDKPGICGSCAQKKRQLQEAAKNKPKVSVAAFIVTTQTAPKVNKNSLPIFKTKASAIAAGIHAYAKDKINENEESSFGDQETIKSLNELLGNGTTTVDFQGVRLGGSTYFLDFQGQSGKSKSRDSYFEVMIACGNGVPGEDLIEEAILDSLKGQLRSVIKLETNQDMPKTK